MIKTELTCAPPKLITIQFPFLWKDTGGRVWLRNGAKAMDARDVLLLPGPDTGWNKVPPIGAVTECETSDYDAWNARLGPNELVTLLNVADRNS